VKLRSAFALLLIGLGIACYTPLVIMSALGPYRWRWWLARSWARFALRTLERLCGVGYTVTGAEHLAGDTPSIVFCKHQSAWETVAMIAICPAHTWVLKRELMWVPFLGWALAAMRPVAIRRGTGRAAVLQVVEQGRRVLASGRWLMIFPEGTRLPPFATRRFGVGGAVLATETGAPVVPVAVNAGHFWPRKGLITRRGTVRVIVGPPIASAGKTPEQLNAEAKAWVDATMATIEPPPA
jgi:1-acyl-sn-glycerol-3-phosphate acyltransferase